MGAGLLAVFEAIALAVQLQDVDVMGQPVEQRAGEAFGTRTNFGERSRSSTGAGTLVVDVTNVNGYTWIDDAGNFHTDAVRMVERLTLVDPDTIHYQSLRGAHSVRIRSSRKPKGSQRMPR